MFGKDYALKGSLSLSDCFRTLKYKEEYKAKHPDALDRSGIIVFCGEQGSGKTLSGVQYTKALVSRFPRSILVTNTDIKGLPSGYDVRPYEGIRSLVDITNGEYGVLYFLDELHLEFNSLESKNVPLEVFTEISQQRKQRKHIIGTSQLFLRLAKPFREQASKVVLCQNILGVVQCNTVLDGSSLREENGEIVGSPLGTYYWFHSPALYECYDTYAKISRRYGDAWKKGTGSDSLPFADLFGGSGSGGASAR